MKRRGFTLVEMLVVLAVIGTLAGIGIPVDRRLCLKCRSSDRLIPKGRAILPADERFFLQRPLNKARNISKVINRIRRLGLRRFFDRW